MTDRPRRTLAAWGYQSSASGDRIEVDVWTVNPVTPDVPDAIERAREAFGSSVARVVAAYGNVARVEYPGAAGEGYRYIVENEPASQQAYAGSKRAAGGDRTGRGTFGTGYSEPEGAPGIEEAIAYGEQEVLPVVRRAMPAMGNKISRESSRDEVSEPVETEPFSGFKSVVRVFTRGSTFRYPDPEGTDPNGFAPGGRR